MADPKWDETEEIVNIPSFDETSPVESEDISGIPNISDIEQELLAGRVSVPKTEAAAALRGAVQEGTVGLADEAGAALSTLVSDFSDKNAPKDLKGLLEKYQVARDKTRRENKELEEMFPKSYLAGQVAGGVLPALFTGGAGVAAQAAKQGGKELAKLGLKTGTMYGAAQGVGRSESELLEGDFKGLAGDIASEAALGGAVGGTLPLAGTAVKGAASKAGELLKKIPGVESGYKLGKEGISTSYESLMKEFRGVSKTLSNKIREGLKKEGVAKAEALELADAIGISLNAGDPVDTAIEKAMNLKNVPEAERARFTTFLQKLVGEDPELSKQIAKIDQLRAKQIARAAREGFELEGTEQIGKRIEDVVPDSSVQGTLLGTEDVLRKTTEEGQEVTKKLLNLQTLADDLNLPGIDVQDLSPTQMEDLIKQVNKFANPGKKGNPTEVEVVARNLAGELRKLANKASQGTSVEGANRNIAALLDAIKQSGMKGKVSSTVATAAEGSGARFLREEQERQLQKKLMDASQFGDVDVQSLFSRLKEVDPKFADIEERTRLLKDAMTIAQSGEGSASTSARALIGGAQKMAALASNVAGKTVKKLEGASPSKVLLQTGKAVREASPESIQNLLTRIEGSPAYKAYIPALQNAANATTDASRKLIMFGLHQQPAFREMLRSMGAGADQKSSLEYNQPSESFFENTEEVEPNMEDKTSFLDSAKKAAESISDFIIPKAAASDDLSQFMGKPRGGAFSLDKTGAGASFLNQIAEDSNKKTPVYEQQDFIDTLKSEEGTKGDKTGAAITGYHGVTAAARNAVGTDIDYKKAKTEAERKEIDDKTFNLYNKYLYEKASSSLKDAPDSVQKAALNIAYNRGESFLTPQSTFINKVNDGNYKDAFLFALNNATAKGNTLKGLAQRYTSNYNRVMQDTLPQDQLEDNIITTIRQNMDDLQYLNSKGEVVLEVNKPRHKDSIPGNLILTNKGVWISKPNEDTEKYLKLKKSYDDLNKIEKLNLT
jgi:GH24 family phage-related lysozyme (muramidase)